MVASGSMNAPTAIQASLPTAVLARRRRSTGPRIRTADGLAAATTMPTGKKMSRPTARAWLRGRPVRDGTHEAIAKTLGVAVQTVREAWAKAFAIRSGAAVEVSDK